MLELKIGKADHLKNLIEQLLTISIKIIFGMPRDLHATLIFVFWQNLVITTQSFFSTVGFLKAKVAIISLVSHIDFLRTRIQFIYNRVSLRRSLNNNYGSVTSLPEIKPLSSITCSRDVRSFAYFNSWLSVQTSYFCDS